jgi:polyribonucleotide nucleotidyltransferase
VVRLAEFGAFVEIFPGTDGLLHVSEIAEHRVKEVKDELREGDQVLVKVLAIEGNRIKLSRKAVLREQRAKLGLPEVPEGSSNGGGRSERQDRGERPERGERSERSERGPRPERAERSERAERPKHEETITLEGGEDFDDDGDEELEIDGEETEGDEAEVTVPAAEGSAAPQGGDRPAGQKRRRRRGGRRGPGSGAPAQGGNS